MSLGAAADNLPTPSAYREEVIAFVKLVVLDCRRVFIQDALEIINREANEQSKK